MPGQCVSAFLECLDILKLDWLRLPKSFQWMSHRFSKVLLHFVRVNVPVGEPSPCILSFLLFLFKKTRICELDWNLVFKICWHYLHFSTDLFLSHAIMIIWSHFFCCQGFFNTNFNDLLAVNKLSCVSEPRVFTQAGSSLCLAVCLWAGRFLRSREV